MMNMHVKLPSAEVYGVIVPQPDSTGVVYDSEVAGSIILSVLRQRGYRSHVDGPVEHGHILVRQWADADALLAAEHPAIVMARVVRVCTGNPSIMWSIAHALDQPEKLGRRTAVDRKVLHDLRIDSRPVSMREVVMQLRVATLAAHAPSNVVWLAPCGRARGLWVEWPESLSAPRHELRRIAQHHEVPWLTERRHSSDLPAAETLTGILHRGPLEDVVHTPRTLALYRWLSSIGRRFLADPLVLSYRPFDAERKALVVRLLGETALTWEHRVVGSMVAADDGRFDAYMRKQAGRRVVVVGRKLERLLGLRAVDPGSWVEPPMSSAVRCAALIYRVLRARHGQHPAYHANASGLPIQAQLQCEHGREHAADSKAGQAAHLAGGGAPAAGPEGHDPATV